MTEKPELTTSGTLPEPLRILVIYYSRFGAIRDLAGQLREGATRVPGVEVDLLEVGDDPLPELQGAGLQDEAASLRRTALLNRVARADALAIGGPAYFGSLASPLKRFFEDLGVASSPVLDRTRPWHHYLFRDKPGAAFVSSATPHGGNEQALHSMLTLMMHLGMLVVTPGQRGPILEQPAAPYGATAITGPQGQRGLTDDESGEARTLGQRLAEVATWLRAGRLLETDRLRAAIVARSQHFDRSA
jgi:NAD(P)H dehydrogenase (quinone)